MKYSSRRYVYFEQIYFSLIDILQSVITKTIQYWKQSTLNLKSEKVQRRRLQYKVHEFNQKFQLIIIQSSVVNCSEKVFVKSLWLIFHCF